MSFWAEAVATKTYLRNRIVTTALKTGCTTYKIVFWKEAQLDHETPSQLWLHSLCPHPRQKPKKLDMKLKLRCLDLLDTLEQLGITKYRKEVLCQT